MNYLFGDPGPRQIQTKATAAPPGTGPTGETCGTCRHCKRIKYRTGVYHKCGLMESYWTHGAGSDIKKRWPACRFWETGKKEQQ